jgi:hypothetical protein
MKNRFEINEKGFWETNTDIGHVHDKPLCNSLILFLNKNKIKNLVDFGCGMGDYVKAIMNENIICEAYDGNPNTEQLTNGIAKVLDLSKKFNLDKKFDCVLSFEVGEHIPKDYEQIFIDNLCNHSEKFIILSWAIIGQSGDGHVNCQNNDYIISELAKRNFSYEPTASIELRNSVSNAKWFKNTIMIFKKTK